MKKILLILLIAGMHLLQAEENAAKIVYDLTTKDLAKFERTILKGIVVNKEYYGSALKELDVTVVIHGGAYRFFTKDPEHSIYKDLAKRIKAMVEHYDVEFLMCGAGMRKNKLEAKDVYNFVKIIPNSTIGLIDRQNNGYAYIPVGN